METLVIVGALAIGYTIGKTQNNESYYSNKQKKQKKQNKQNKQKKIIKRRSNTPPRTYKKSLELRAPSRT